MADNDRSNLSTCPICGYTDTADDSQALQMAIEEHIRMSHNLDPATLGGTTGSVRSVTNDTAAEVSGNNNNNSGTFIPIIAASPNSGGSGAPSAGAGFGAGAVLLGADALNDNDNNNRNRRDDDTSR
ncbi:MAG: hypothetical protein JWP00_2972 [Chloroflexi bacterium]|nr:hypothetical protein [Chloroflexota bacterium]